MQSHLWDVGITSPCLATARRHTAEEAVLYTCGQLAERGHHFTKLFIKCACIRQKSQASRCQRTDSLGLVYSFVAVRKQ